MLDYYEGKKAHRRFNNLAPLLEEKGLDPQLALDANYVPSGQPKEYDDQFLQNDKNFQAVGRVMYNMDVNANNKKLGTRGVEKNIPQTDLDFANYALDQLGWFNYNIPQMIYDGVSLSKATPDQRIAFYYGMKAYDRLKNFTRSGTARFFNGVVADPSTYLGLGTIGLAVRSLTKKGLTKAGWMNTLKLAGVGATEGSAYAAIDDYFRQDVAIGAEAQESFDLQKYLKFNIENPALVGAAAGGIPTAAPAVATKLGKEAIDLAKRVEIDDSATLSANPIPFRLKDKTIKSLDDIKNKYPEVDLSLSTKPEGITLSKIIVPENNRSEGVGTKVMNDLINFADENNLKIALTPDNTFGGSKARLKEFYKKFGFVNNKGRNKDFAFRETLIRQPKNKEARKSVIEQNRKEANIDRFGYDPNDPTQNKKVEARPRDESSGHAADIVPASFGPPAHDMNMRIEEEFSPKGISTFSTDVGNNYENLKFFITSQRGTKEYDQEVAFFRKLFDIKGNPDAEVTIYRASPTDDLRPGDLVTPIKADAEFYVEQSKVTRQDIRDAEKKRRLEGDEPVDLAKEKTIKKMDAIIDIFPETKVTPSKVFTYKVKAKDLRWDGNNGLVRWGYFPQDNVTEIKKQ